jgi:hypothetical protein
MLLASIVLFYGYDVSAFRQLGSGLWFVVALSLIWIFIKTIYDEESNKIRNYTSLIREMKNLTKDQYQALGIKFPHFRTKLGAVEPVTFFEDTNATYEQFVYYIRSSNDRQVAPLREWRTTERPARIWHEITDYLIKAGYVQKSSAAGNHSHLWLFQSYAKIREMYLKPKMVNMAEREITE